MGIACLTRETMAAPLELRNPTARPYVRKKVSVGHARDEKSPFRIGMCSCSLYRFFSIVPRRWCIGERSRSRRVPERANELCCGSFFLEFFRASVVSEVFRKIMYMRGSAFSVNHIHELRNRSKHSEEHGQLKLRDLLRRRSLSSHSAKSC